MDQIDIQFSKTGLYCLQRKTSAGVDQNTEISTPRKIEVEFEWYQGQNRSLDQELESWWG